MIDLSIIIPVYNVEPFLEQCLTSLAAQNCDSVEYLLIDDGSTDSGGDICDRWAAADPRFRVLHKKNGGVSSARNEGLRLSRGRWIGFADGDDWLEPGALGRVMSALAECPEADAVCFGFYDHYTGGTVVPEPGKTVSGATGRDRAIANVLAEGGYFTSVWNKLFSRALILEEGRELLFDTGLSIGEDEKYLIEALAGCSSCLFVPEPMYHYRYRESSALNSNAVTEPRLGSLKLKRELADSLGWNDSLRRAARARLYNRAVPLMAAAYCAGDANSLKRIRKELKGTWMNWLFAGDIALSRKAKVLAVSTLMRVKAPGTAVERIMNIRKK